MSQNTRLVYSTDSGRVCPACQKPAGRCQCKRNKSKPASPSDRDGIIRIGRETKGRKGKGVTTIDGLPGNPDALKALAAELKRCCGSGGTVKDGRILIQGDHRAVLLAELNRQGYRVKSTGG